MIHLRNASQICQLHLEISTKSEQESTCAVDIHIQHPFGVRLDCMVKSVIFFAVDGDGPFTRPYKQKILASKYFLDRS